MSQTVLSDAVGETKITTNDNAATEITPGQKAAILKSERLVRIKTVWHHLNLSALVAVTCLGAWMVLFVCGTFVNASQVIQNAINTPVFSFRVAVSFFAGVMCWTWTNLLMLSVLSSFLGGIARVWDNNINYREVQFDALTTGFIVFMLFMFEESLMGGRLNPSTNPDAQGTYMRLVIVTSLLSFVGSYHPDFHRQLLRRFMDARNEPADANPAVNKPR